MTNAIEFFKAKCNYELFIEGGNCIYVYPFQYLQIRRNLDFYGQADYVLLDGMILTGVFNLFGISQKKRMSIDFSGIGNELFSFIEKGNRTVYFIGANPDEVEKFQKNISLKFPRLNVVGVHHGYLNRIPDFGERLKEEIVEINPEFIFAGMGSPLQEKFLFDLKEKGWKGTGYTCGGFIFQTSLNIEYYPKWVNLLRVRWLYRGIHEPRALIKTLHIPLFILVFLWDYFVYLFRKQKV
jgi:N-acetylglucosaminyldiphosphoundecaprenol N-acetyl-beta-D-mannosaminyltransferase